eukprot:gnl/TRDRNA2_/TRDRNA2_147325_c0_seq1.p1 gnl/TRDRNA2_/TRDRNA2_147325_c0~~gnl/TRDRNA2_/TRDRNA2_147325_c0_seq1.p1  ORF type:complete len:219 (+),score=56.20 gnl/TRDRNA2_/TRDRNA2_147325_c0_seq1:118-774(+)
MTKGKTVVELDSFPRGVELLQKYRDAEQRRLQGEGAEASSRCMAGSAYDSTQWRGVSAALDAWHDIVDASVKMDFGTGEPSEEEQRVMEQLGDLLADDMVFHPPTYWKSRRGKMMGTLILSQVGKIFGKNFRYHRQLVDASRTNVVLEFSAMVDDVPVQGVDLVEFDKEGKIIDFKVMVRPPEAGLRLKAIMQQRMEIFMKSMGIQIPPSKNVPPAKL